MNVTVRLTILATLVALHAARAAASQAQEYVVAVAEENFRSRPNGAKLGTLRKGAEVSALREQGRWVQASLRGWIWARSVKPARDRSTVLVAAGSENLRATPSPGGRLLGTVLRGTGLTRLGARSGWVQVEYDGWIWQPSLSEGAPLPNAGGDVAPAPAAARTLSVSEENLRAAPNGRRLGVLRRGADLTVTGSKGSWLEVGARGWFWAASAVGSGSSREVAAATENLRIAPGSEIMGVLDRGTGLKVLGRAGGWLEVELRGWIWEASTRSLAGTAAGAEERRPEKPAAAEEAPVEGTEEAAASPPGRPAATAAAPRADPAAQPPRLLAHSVPLRNGPEGALVGQALTGTSVVPVRTSGEWVKVRFEGWIRQDALAAATPPPGAAPAGGVTVAMAAADPEAFRGVETTWTLELIAVERADGSRSDFPAGQHYLLTRHAGGEREYVYVTVPEEIAVRFRDTRPFAELRIRGVIRTGRSALVGNPILEYRELLGG